MIIKFVTVLANVQLLKRILAFINIDLNKLLLAVDSLITIQELLVGLNQNF